jgi:hypothetical protein
VHHVSLVRPSYAVGESSLVRVPVHVSWEVEVEVDNRDDVLVHGDLLVLNIMDASSCYMEAEIVSPGKVVGLVIAVVVVGGGVAVAVAVAVGVAGAGAAGVVAAEEEDVDVDVDVDVDRVHPVLEAQTLGGELVEDTCHLQHIEDLAEVDTKRLLVIQLVKT